MNPYELSTLIASFWLLAMVHRCIVRVRRERFRLRVRMIRDDLFDFMWKNGHSFDDPSYRDARQALNGMLRLSNTMTPMKFMIFAFQERRPSRRMVAFVNSPESALKERLLQAYSAAVCEWARFLFLSGSVGVLARLLISCLKTVSGARRFATAFKDVEQRWLGTAYDFGAPSLTCSERAILHA